MKKTYYSLTALLMLSVLTVNAQKKVKSSKGKAPVPVQTTLTALDSASYSFGLKIAQGLKSDGVSSLNYSLLTKAMEDVFKDAPTLLSSEQSSTAISSFLEAASKAKYSVVMQENEKFFADNKVKPGVTTTPSGLQYEVITLGTGPKPKAEDEVTVHYKGTLLDGKQFDSSYDRNEPIALTLNRVIPGWTEGVPLMPVGSKFKFYIPYKLGYGEAGAGQDIPPYSTLIFEIELLKIGK